MSLFRIEAVGKSQKRENMPSKSFFRAEEGGSVFCSHDRQGSVTDPSATVTKNF